MTITINTIDENQIISNSLKCKYPRHHLQFISH